MSPWLLVGIRASLRQRFAWWLRSLGRRLSPAGVYLGDGQVLTKLVFGETMLVDGRDRSIASVLIAHGLWEPDVTGVVLQHARPGMRAIDVGANYGYYTLLLCRAVGAQGKVFAFEPQAHLHSFLAHNIDSNCYGHIARAYRLALGDSSGARRLSRVESRLGSLSGSGSLREEVASELLRLDEADTLATEVVEVSRLDDLDLGSVDFAKIDVEGTEYEVWRGGRKSLSGARSLVLEYVPRWLQEGQAMLTELRDYGFGLAVIESGGRAISMADAQIHSVAVERGFVYILARKRDAR